MKAGITSLRSRSTRKRIARFRCPALREKNAVRTTEAMSAWRSEPTLANGSCVARSPRGTGGWGGGSWAPSAGTIPRTSIPASIDGHRITRDSTESLPFRRRVTGSLERPATILAEPSPCLLRCPNSAEDGRGSRFPPRCRPGSRDRTEWPACPQRWQLPRSQGRPVNLSDS